MEPAKAFYLDDTVMKLPPVRLFYRMVAVNESGRSAPSTVFPLLLCSDDPNTTILYHAGPENNHLLRLTYDCSTCRWDLTDLTLFGAPLVGTGSIKPFRSCSVVYCSSTNHLIEMDVTNGTVTDHTDEFRVSSCDVIASALAPSHWGSQFGMGADCCCDDHHCNHLYSGIPIIR